jgi:uncharacterized protein (DUF433 family)
MEQTERIVRDPRVAGGAWVIKGTRIPVKTILSSLADGDSVQDILTSFPTLSEDDVRAVITWAVDSDQILQ